MMIFKTIKTLETHLESFAPKRTDQSILFFPTFCKYIWNSLGLRTSQWQTQTLLAVLSLATGCNENHAIVFVRLVGQWFDNEERQRHKLELKYDVNK